MRLRLTLVTLAALTSVGLAHTALAQEESAPDAKTLGKRAVPTPAGISKELHELIASRQIPPALPVPETREAWLEVQRTWDANNAKAARDLAKKLGATWESIEVAGVPCFLVTPKEIGERFKDRWFVHLHGGAFVLNGGEGCLTEALWVADACQARVLSVDYRRPPVHPFPAAVEDAVAVWKAVIKKQDGSATALFGTSAGGNLTLATTLKLKQLGLPLPGAMFAGTPATDLEKIGDTWYTLEGLDPLGRYDGFLRGCFEAYVPSKDFSDPLISPARGDVRGFPPTILISGTRDLLLSDTVRMHRALRKADVEADLHVYEGQSHADYISGAPVDAPESQDAQKEIFRFFDKHLK
jgi:acetyl esterase/lipase